MKQLINSIESITKQAGGTWGISLDDLDKKETWTSNEDELFYAASVIKVPILLAAFTAFDQRKFSLSDTVKLRKEDLVGGSGVLQHMTPGTRLTIYDLVTLMIIQSDNTATNMVIDLVGTKKIQQTMEDLGLENSRFYNKLMVVPANLEGRNLVTAADMTSMLKQMVMGEVVSMHACEQMIDMLKKQQLQNCLPARLPEQDSEIIGTPNEWELAHKTGSISRVCHDIGILYVGNRTMVVSILSKGVEDRTSPKVIADIGWEIYHYLKEDNYK
ncbi:serine hydrolase [Virgibacillus necropolis]|uniref:Serine hydrolase n=1 Tax=Virgibacillus necropolis TaxID=163877 RepID=A0A221MAB5_9BACI|nr:serine hydrolase [Virgibacillus necropolis]ASN04584.1 serine hydrolase [Virgibacillus necropolis]